MQLSYCVLALLGSWCVGAQLVFNGLEPHDRYPRLLNTEDPRDDGIAHEIHLQLVAEHLEATKWDAQSFKGHGTTLEDLMEPGLQHLSLSYWNHLSTPRTDYFLRILKASKISQDSSWTVNVRGMWGQQGNITLLADIIRTLPAITEFHWDTQWYIPAIVLDSLQRSHPECRLYYTLAYKNRGLTALEVADSSTDQKMMYLARDQEPFEGIASSVLESKNLYSLKAHIDHGSLHPSDKLVMIHKILITCPNLRELELKIELPKPPPCDGTKCCDCEPTKELLAFDFTEYDGMMAPLEVLKIEGYRFDFAVNGRPEPQASRPLAMANLKAWFKHMDWSHLHTLHLSNAISNELILFRDLPKLQHFGIDGGKYHHVRPRMDQHLAKFQPLKSLAIQEAELRPLDSLLDVIQKNHSTLHTFKLNHLKDGPRVSGIGDGFSPGHFQYASPTFLDIAQLDRLFKICPDLQSLDLDLQTGKDWNYEMLDKLSSFPKLKELTLRFPPEKSSQLYGGMHHIARDHEQPEYKIAMKGVRNYLRKRKIGEPFTVLRTFLGWRELADGESERGPAWMYYE